MKSSKNKQTSLQTDPVIATVDIEQVTPNDYNPNIMADAKFEMLGEDVGAEGMDQPLVVRPDPDNEGRYVIVDGEHRYRAAKAAGHSKVLVTVKDWDETTAKLRTIRRNLLRGELDRAKFTRLVQEVSKDTELDVNEVRRQMGFMSEREFNAYYLKDKDQKTDNAVSALADEVKEKSTDVSMVSEMVRQIILQHGDTLQAGLVCFSYKGSIVLAIDLPKAKVGQAQKVADLARDLGVSRAGLSAKVGPLLEQLSAALEEELSDI